jgi:hypothetical protein
MRTLRGGVWLSVLLVLCGTAGQASAQEQSRSGGVLTWREYADPGRLDFHSESPLSVLQGDFHFIGGQATLMNSPDVHDPFSVVFHSTGSRNYSGFADAKIDELIERSLHEADPSQRQHIYRELQRYILSQPLPMLTLGWLDGWFYVDKRVRNFKPGKLIYEGLTHTTLWLSEK